MVSSGVDLALLQRISLAVAEHRETSRVLQLIVAGLVQQAGCALARIWLMVPATENIAPYLQLAASAGQSLGPSEPSWSRLDGRFRRFSLGERKIGTVGATGTPVLIEDAAHSGDWDIDRAWASVERIQSFAGQPLIFRGEILGVLGVFSRAPLGRQEFAWLRLFADQAAVAIANARAFEQIEELRLRLERENQYLREEVSAVAGGMVGESVLVRNLQQQIELVAPTDVSVLIQGESGTGKELVARAIHQRSARQGKPLVKVNCASVPQELFESEFFGHVKGAFTGAVRSRLGRFQLADQATLFLDEVAEIPLALQGKLLRVLQEGEFEQIGEDHTRRVNVRVIAATNRDLSKEAAAGRFREDLYYRLNVFPVLVPPLRQRRSDVPLLAQHFLTQACRRMHAAPRALTEREAGQLMAYGWPGNIRELQNVIERAVILSRGGGPLRFDLPAVAEALPRPAAETSLTRTRTELRALERQNIERAVAQAQGKIYGPGGAAELLGMKPTTLASRMTSLGISRRGTGQR